MTGDQWAIVCCGVRKKFARDLAVRVPYLNLDDALVCRRGWVQQDEEQTYHWVLSLVAKSENQRSEIPVCTLGYRRCVGASGLGRIAWTHLDHVPAPQSAGVAKTKVHARCPLANFSITTSHHAPGLYRSLVCATPDSTFENLEIVSKRARRRDILFFDRGAVRKVDS